MAHHMLNGLLKAMMELVCLGLNKNHLNERH